MALCHLGKQRLGRSDSQWMSTNVDCSVLDRGSPMHDDQFLIWPLLQRGPCQFRLAPQDRHGVHAEFYALLPGFLVVKAGRSAP